jgi:hypothetical protein
MLRRSANMRATKLPQPFILSTPLPAKPRGCYRSLLKKKTIEEIA